MSLTLELREELAHLPVRNAPERLAETSAIVRFGGSLRLQGGTANVTYRVQLARASVARRLLSTIREHFDDGVVTSHQLKGGLSGATRYVVDVAKPALQELQILDREGHPALGLGTVTEHASAYLAGVMMTTATLSGHLRPVHFEVAAPSAATANDIAPLLGATVTGNEGTRLVVKNATVVGALLVRTGAHQTFLKFEQGRMRRQLKGDVNRRVNADRANLRRSADAAHNQVVMIQDVLEVVGLDGLEPSLRHIALARLANPAASLSELGALLDPPIGKTAVHRRFAALDEIHQKRCRSGE